jgi:hypothetical protein
VSDTPRTDMVGRSSSADARSAWFEMRDLAFILERENRALVEERKELTAALKWTLSVSMMYPSTDHNCLNHQRAKNVLAKAGSLP